MLQISILILRKFQKVQHTFFSSKISGIEICSPLDLRDLRGFCDGFRKANQQNADIGRRIASNTGWEMIKIVENSEKEANQASFATDMWTGGLVLDVLVCYSHSFDRLSHPQQEEHRSNAWGKLS